MWITDEYGIERKHKEVIRKPLNEEYIKVITDLYEEEGIQVGSLHLANKDNVGDVFVFNNDKETVYLNETEYVVLEETNILIANNTHYQQLNRKPRLKDKILVLRDNDRKGFKKGTIGEVIKVEGELINAYNIETEEVFMIWEGEFIVIEPMTLESSVKDKLEELFDSTEISILFSDIPLESAFDLILKYREVKNK